MTIFLQNVLVKPGHEDTAIAALRNRPAIDGVELLDAYLETGPGFTYRLASGEQGAAGAPILTSLWSAPDDFVGIGDPQAFAGEVSLRRVEPEVVNPVTPETLRKMIVLRRYRI